MSTAPVTDGVPLDDRGLAYGDGLFETMALHGGRILAVDEHLARLERGCGVLGFSPPPRESIREAIARICSVPEPGILKLLLTRGSGGRGYQPPPSPRPRLRLSLHPWPDGIEEARRSGVGVVRLRTRLGENPALAGIKHLNRLDQVLAAAELGRHAPAVEGIVADQGGRPVCGVMSNLFIVIDGALVTPAIRGCGVAGIVRGAVLALSREGRCPPVDVRAVSDGELEAAEEVFLTNSIRGVLPVKRLDGLARAAPGPVTVAIGAALESEGILA